MVLEKGQPLLFGESNDKGLVWQDSAWHLSSAEHARSHAHDPSQLTSAMALAYLNKSEFPIPLGIYYQHARDIFRFDHQPSKSHEDLEALFRSKQSWKIHKE